MYICVYIYIYIYTHRIESIKAFVSSIKVSASIHHDDGSHRMRPELRYSCNNAV